MARRFRWADFQPITVTPLPVDPARKQWTARFAVVDGQHRFEAARLVPGIVEVPCYIVALPDVGRQAQAFVDINRSRSPVTSYDLFRAALVAKDPSALHLERVLKLAGVTLAPIAIGPKPMHSQAVSALRRGLVRHGEKALLRALASIGTAWPKEPMAFTERPIIACGRLFHLHPQASDTALTAFLRTRTPANFSYEVWQRAEADGCEPAEALRRLIVTNT